MSEPYNMTIEDLYDATTNVTIDNTDLATFGIVATRGTAWDAPERMMEVFDVPGRNGALVYDYGSYKNVELVYHCSILENARSRVKALKEFLYSDFGYRTLTDSTAYTDYAPAFRKARVISPIHFNFFEARGYDACTFDLVFDAKPQVFMGGRAIRRISVYDIEYNSSLDSYTATFTITNDYSKTSKPFILFRNPGYTSEQENVKETTIRVYHNDDASAEELKATPSHNPSTAYALIDSERQTVTDGLVGSYYDTIEYRHSYFAFSGTFPTLHPGDNDFTISNLDVSQLSRDLSSNRYFLVEYYANYWEV